MAENGNGNWERFMRLLSGLGPMIIFTLGGLFIIAKIDQRMDDMEKSVDKFTNAVWTQLNTTEVRLSHIESHNAAMESRQSGEMDRSTDLEQRMRQQEGGGSVQRKRSSYPVGATP